MRLAFVVAHGGRRCSRVEAVRPSGVCRGDDLVGVVTGQDHDTWVVREQPAHRGASILSQVHVKTLRHVLTWRGAGVPGVFC